MLFRSLLLLLQVLMILMLIAACLSPGCEGEELEGGRFIFMIDQSASMSAKDVRNGTRLEEAKRLVAQTIDRMKPSDAAMLISFSNRAEVVQSYTTNRSQLKRKLQDIPQTERGTDLTEALTAASGLANPGRTSTKETDIQVADSIPAKLMIFSDGGVASVPNFSLGNLVPEYFPVGGFESPGNVGITAFALSDESGAEKKMQLFAQLKNSLDKDRQVSVSLLIDGQIFDAQANVALKAGESKGISFNLTALVATISKPQKIKLQIDDPDIYHQDNVVFGVLNPPRPVRILVVTPGNDYLRLALETEAVSKIAKVTFQNRDFLKDKQYLADATLGNYDLIIYDLCVPETFPLCSTLFFGTVPPGETWKFGERQFPTPVVDYDRSHPIMNSLQLLRLSIVEASPISAPAGSQSLLDATYGTVISIGSRGSFQDLVISFPLMDISESGEVVVNTNWPSQLSFPLFMQNSVNFLTGGARYFTAENTSPGDLVRMRLPQSVDEVTIETPDKRFVSVKRGRDNSMVFNGTDHSGWYLVTLPTAENTQQPFSVNLLDAKESDLTVRDKLEIGFEQVTATKSMQPARKEYWKWLAALALVILLVEWVIYNRRVFM